MARPPTIRDEDLLLAARETLLEHGLGATTAQVAKRAGVSEGSIFNRFKTKEELFRTAAIRAADTVWLSKLPGRIGRGVFDEQLAEVAHDGIEFFRILIPFVMLEWGRNPHDHNDPSKMGPITGVKRLAAYFEGEMRLERIARHDPEIVARTFLGALWNYVSFDLMFDAQTHLPMPEPTFVRSLVRMLLEGLKPAPPKGR